MMIISIFIVLKRRSLKRSVALNWNLFEKQSFCNEIHLFNTQMIRKFDEDGRELNI